MKITIQLMGRLAANAVEGGYYFLFLSETAHPLNEKLISCACVSTPMKNMGKRRGDNRIVGRAISTTVFLEIIWCQIHP